MTKSFLLLDEISARISETPITDQGLALSHAASVNASHVLACDEMLFTGLVERLHRCRTREEIWDVVAAELNGVVETIPVSNVAIAAALRKPRPGEYPANIARNAKPIWDALVVNDRFKKAIVGRPLVAAFAVAVKWLEDMCRRKGIHPFIDGDAAGKPDASASDKFMRELRICKSYVEQVFRNLRESRCVSRQSNWTALKVSTHGMMFTIKSVKRLTLATKKVDDVIRVFKRYDGFQNQDLKSKPTPNTMVFFDLRSRQNDIVVNLTFDLTKAQLAALVEVPATTSVAILVVQAQQWLQKHLHNTLREVVAGEFESQQAIASGETDTTQREKVRRVARKIVIALAKGKGKINDDGTVQIVVRDSALLGNKVLVVLFEDSKIGANTGGEFERNGKFARLHMKIECDFRHYGLPMGVRRDVEDTDLFTSIEHELIHLADARRTFGRDNEGYNQKVFPGGDRSKLNVHNYYNTPAEKNAYLQSMISEWARRGDHADLDKTFPEFIKAFKQFWSHDRKEHEFITHLDSDGERRFINRLYSYWKLNKSAVTASSNELRVMDEFEIEPIGGGEKRKLPKGAVLRLVKHEEGEEPVYQVAHPVDVIGIKVVLTKEQHERCAHIDNDIETFDGSIDAAFELLTEEFNSLPTFRTPALKVGKLLGTIETWPFAENRSWMHHLNLKVKHPSLTFEIINHAGQKHLAAIYHGEW